MPDKTSAEAEKPVIVLFRHDLRVADNRALTAAAETGRPVVPVFVFDEESKGVRRLGGARRWWLHNAIAALAARLKGLGAPLVLRRGAMATQVQDLAASTGADTVFWNRRYEPAAAHDDDRMEAALEERGIACESFEGQLLHEPRSIRTGNGTPYRVYTPFWRALVDAGEPREPLAAPRELRPFGKSLDGEALADWKLLPTGPDWAGGLCETWSPGEDGAWKRLDAFMAGGVEGYGRGRDMPAKEATSRLSPHLAHGEISPFQVWHAARRAEDDMPRSDLEKFRKELAWREFCWHLLCNFPDLPAKNFNEEFDAFPWQRDAKALKRWQKGETGVPIVDAGMRELWRTGWMHNRVRMIVASFLIKDLLIDWREGEAWFWDTLVDADAASNVANWQWVAGSGADAAPYFRIFNPALQGKKFDSDGDYVRHYVPELGKLAGNHLHAPSSAPESALRDAGVKLGGDYPVAIVNHREARERALAAYRKIKGDS